MTLPGRQDGGDAARRPVLRADLARAEAAGPDTLARLPLLYALSENSLTTREETSAWARRALALLDMAGAPPLARLAVEAWAVGSQDVERESSKRYFERLGQMRAQAPYAADPEARSAIASMIADSSKHDDPRRAMLSSIGDESGLTTAHPLKAGALMRLASLERAAGGAGGVRKIGPQSRPARAARQAAGIRFGGRDLPDGGHAPGVRGLDTRSVRHWIPQAGR